MSSAASSMIHAQEGGTGHNSRDVSRRSGIGRARTGPHRSASRSKSRKQAKAVNIHEIMVYDSLPQRDRDLLEKSQKLLGESKLYELERTNTTSGKRSVDASQLLERSYLAQQRSLERQAADPDGEVARMKSLSAEVDEL